MSGKSTSTTPPARLVMISETVLLAWRCVEAGTLPALGGSQANVSRFRTRGGCPRTFALSLLTASATCAIVPLYPKELTPPFDACGDSPPSCTGSRQLTGRSMPRSCGLSVRSCGLGAASVSRSPRASFKSPIIPAADSEWPVLALSPPTLSGSEACTRCLTTLAHSEPTSIGSPRAVPVPWVSANARSTGRTPPSACATSNSVPCACPFGAVRLALRPSCRTALPLNVISAATMLQRTTAPIASPRTKPSARRSNV
eukprot:3655215-Prymnesium_polylepis.2